MAKGTLVLKTNGGERKMSYSLVDGTYIMGTQSNSNKIAQIKADNQVTTDLTEQTYTAQLVAKTDSEYNDVRSQYLSMMGGFQKFIYTKMFGKKNDMFIILK